MKTVIFLLCFFVLAPIVFAGPTETEKEHIKALQDYRKHLTKNLPADHPVARRVDLGVKIFKGETLTEREIFLVANSIRWGDFDYLGSDDSDDLKILSEKIRLRFARDSLSLKIEQILIQMKETAKHP